MVRAVNRTPVALASILALTCAAGCKEAEKPAAQQKSAEAQRPAPTPAAETSDPACLAPWNPAGAERTVEVGATSFKITGTKLTGAMKDHAGETILGVMSDIKEETPENVANIDAILDFFKREKAQAIVIAGDLGEEEAQIEHVLDRIAAAKLPMFVVIGNRESRAAFNSAVAASAGRFGGIFNLNQLRLVTLDDLALVSMPGYYNKIYVHAADGCDYKPADVEATRAIILAAAPKPVVMVSHGPPRQDGADALDRTLEQVNVGDPSLARLLKETNVKFGLFANIHESGGRATNLAGTQLIAQGKPVEELYMNAGPSDAVKWKMNDGTESVGMAGLFVLKGKEASFKIHRMPVK
jgi:Icc-related predicted phosphoesterase